MENEERNALAELADELVGCANILLEEGWAGSGRAATKARRIIAELAKVPLFQTKNGTKYVRLAESAVAFDKCRAIAEEGAKE